MKSTLSKLLPHLLALLVLFVLAALYASPNLQGKVLGMHDIQQAQAGAQELNEFYKATGRWALWTNSMFSGMPAYMVAGDYPYTFVGKTVAVTLLIIPETIRIVFLMMLGMYVLLTTMGVRRWLAVLGAVAFAFGSYNMIFIKAGHVSKMYALAYMPGILAGVMLALRGRYWIGGAVTALFLCLELASNHLQITYYFGLALVPYIIMEAVVQIKEGRLKNLITTGIVLAVSAAIGIGSYGGRLLVTLDYTKETTRGKTELTLAKPTQPGQAAPTAEATTAPQNGLDRSYAFEYSYGVGETLTLLIPRVYGGATVEPLTDGSDTYKLLVQRGLDPTQAKQIVENGMYTYWGDLPINGGPAYAGAVLIFLAVLGMFIVQHRIKWWVLGATILMLFIAWGKNFAAFGDFMFDHFPLYNKFRAVTMTLSIIQFLLALLAVLAIEVLLTRKPSFAEIKTGLIASFALTGGLALLLWLVGPSILELRKPNESTMLGQMFGDPAFGPDILRALIEDRGSILRADALRTLIFIVLAAGLVWLYVTNKVKEMVLVVALIALTYFDLFFIDKRYFNNDDFTTKRQAQERIAPSPVDEQILQDKSLSYRVMDNRSNFMSDATASYFHKSLGGYHAAKLKRYSELMEYALPKNFMGVINMLNAKYVIQRDPQSNQDVAQQNPEALGNAWFVQNYRLVPDANAEMTALQTLNPKQTAVIDQRYAGDLKGLTTIQYDSTNTIQLVAYQPDQLKYESKAKSEQLAVFSEIFYKGNTDWKSYIDGKEVPHIRVNYLLRGLRIPAGTHTIEFKFDPPVWKTGMTIDLISNIALILLIVAGVVIDSRRK
ncbi:hypothetical protein BWI97_12020 [Siphonobacter sp. BAB-5405]|uniref:YfhO family protein n=1 Tax=Siphonobacter sp. BAB-5405 TaxID=1864825 RepID=UPI000C80F10C|nr:YfhO family protein [Siphonobacter sp. BAB-5405]PMD96517.1 hypothetical protein BWI97_12020 [Siphonobacter sp. BAB-5405]